MSVVDENRDGIRKTIRTELLGGDAPAAEVRTIDFHHCAPADRVAHAKLLGGLGEHHAAADQAGLEALVAGATPAVSVLLPVFYEGYRDALGVLDLVEREGLVAWFFIPTAFLDVPVADQHEWALAHELDLAGDDDPRLALTWDELRDVHRRGHVVACHTASHCGVADVTEPDALEREVGASKARLEEQLDAEVATLAWLWGTASGLDPALDAELVARGYRLVFSNDRIQGLPHG